LSQQAALADTCFPDQGDQAPAAGQGALQRPLETRQSLIASDERRLPRGGGVRAPGAETGPGPRPPARAGAERRAGRVRVDAGSPDRGSSSPSRARPGALAGGPPPSADTGGGRRLVAPSARIAASASGGRAPEVDRGWGGAGAVLRAVSSVSARRCCG